MIVHHMDQRSEDWDAIRVGKLTSSRASAMLATTAKGDYGAQRKQLSTALALERVMGRPVKPVGTGYQSQAMKDGTDREVDACSLYEVLTGNVVQSCGFCEHESLPAGCSVDGYVGAFEGVIELKSPTPAIHLEYLETGLVPVDYMRQVTHILWVTGAQWCDWMSYQPDFPEHLQSKLVRVARSASGLQAHDTAVREFLAEVDATVTKIHS